MQVRLASMRPLFSFLLLSLLILMAGCSAPGATPAPAQVPGATLTPPPPGSSIETAADAVTVANSLFEENIDWIGSPQAVFVEEMSYKEAQERLGVGEGDYDRWSPETRVWLVVFEGQWELMPLGPPEATLTPVRYEGCLFSLFTASAGEWMAAGDAVCPARR